MAAAITGVRGEPVGAVSLSVSRARISPAAAEQRFGPLVTATAHALSFHGLPQVSGPGLQESEAR